MPKIKKKDSNAYRSAKRVRCAQNQAKERQKQDHNIAGFRFQHARGRWEFRLNQRIWLRLSSVFVSRRISFFKIFLVSPQLILQESKVNFKESFHFSRFERGSNIFQGVQLFPGGGGGGVQLLIPY